MSQTVVEVIFKDRKIVDEDLYIVAKEVGEDRHHVSLKYRRHALQSE